MIKEITVAGIKLNSYTAVEYLVQINKRMDANVFTTIEDIYMRTLLLAKEDEIVKDVIESTDITVVAEMGIWDAVEENTIIRKKETERRDFFFKLMKIFEHNRYSVYVLGELQKEVEETCTYLAEEFPRLNIVGTQALEECVGAEEGIINDMNMLAPDVVISVLPSPIQEHFLAEHRAKFSAKLWYGIGSGKITGQPHGFKHKLLKKIRKYKLMNYMKGFEDKKKE